MVVNPMKILFILLAFIGIGSGCIVPEDVARLDNNMARLELQQKELKQRVDALAEEEAKLAAQVGEYSLNRKAKDQNLRVQSADLYVTLDKLRDEMQRLTGRMEETEYVLRQKVGSMEHSDRSRRTRSDRLDEISQSNKDRIARLEQYLNLEPSESRVPKKTAVAPVEKVTTEDQIYLTAKQAFDKGEIEVARDGFQKLIKKYPKSNHADNAQFWIGESYYREKWFEKAILEYQKVIENYPKGNKVQASLLKQGFAFFNLGDKANSRLILNELVTKYPKSNEAKIAREKLKGLR
jgi:tol-pal system protein YbgF